MKTKTFLVLAIALCLFSCKEGKQTQNEENAIPVINLEEALEHLSNKKMNFSEFAKDITYVPLETNDNVTIGGKWQPPTHITNNHIFYGEMMFTRDGKFVRRLGKQGQGPGEYLMALSITVDEKREEFYVLCNYTHDIYIYDFSNTFKRKVKSDPRGSGITALGNGNVMLSLDQYYKSHEARTPTSDYFEYEVLDLDSETSLYTRRQDNKEGNVNCTANKGWQYHNTHFYYEGATDTIFTLTKDGEIKEARYIIERGKYDCSNEEFFIRIGKIAESKSHLFFNISKNKESYYAAYNKATGEMHANEFSKFFNNDIDGGFLWLFNNTGNGKEGYFSILPHIAQERIETLSRDNKGYDKEKNRKLKQLLDDTEEDANEIFYFFHLK